MSILSTSGSSACLGTLPTPSLLLDEVRMTRNISRLKGRMAQLGVALRPHLKTPKSIEIARLLMQTHGGPATVSTLREAEEFAKHGVRDLLYAVGIAPNKLDRVLTLRGKGIDLAIVTDNLDTARAITARARAARDPIPVLIEIDSDGHRSGVQPRQSELLIELGRALHEGGAALRGVMTHAGASYGCRTVEELEYAAEKERAAAVNCATTLREAGLPCPVVSVGSTPTAHFARDLSGVTEVRAGVFVFFDLVMAGIGVCRIADIAVSVLASVIGHQRDKNWIIVDAGWMAMSQDRGTARQAVDQGYGLVCDLDGNPYSDLIMVGANQEHGILTIRNGSPATLPELAVGELVRILPNHACATATQFDEYHVIQEGSRQVQTTWQRFRGW
jgi:D-serine deaminase-like pyridoxal phosphate-dependent protein